MHLKRLGPVALLLLAACDGGAPPATPSTPAPITAAAPPGPVTAGARPVEKRAPEPMPGGGLRLDMSGQSRHVRGLQRQPDGTWKSVCSDDPDGLRPRASGEGAR